MSKIDKAGATASFICAVHCMLMPVIAWVFSASEALGLHSHWIDTSFVAVAAILGPVAIRQGFQRHRSWLPGLLYLIGFAMVATSILVLHGHNHEASALPSIVSAVGGLVIVTFHFVNARLQRKPCCDAVICNHQPNERKA